ncbi:MAG: zinc ribbon domain-containing protein [Verrucomicrobiota bacterium]
MSAPDNCPVCGEDLSPNAKACPECGADERSGWNEDALIYDGLDLPDEVWDEESEPWNESKPGIPLIWKITAVLLVLVVLSWALPNLF